MEDSIQRRSRSRSRSQSQSSQIPLTLIIPQKCIEFFGANQGDQIVRIRDMTGVQKIHFTPDLKLENVKDGLAYIYDESMEFKQKALQAILEQIQDISEEDDIQKQIHAIMIPEPCIGSLIGKNGSTIKQLQKETSTEISIKKEIKGLDERRVEISGPTECATQAITEIQKIIEKGINKGVKEQGQYTNHIKARFIFPNQLVGFIIGKQGSFTKDLQQKYGVKINFFNDQEPPCRSQESICVLSGDLSGVQKSIFKVLEKVQDYIKNHRLKDNGVYMLIPSNLVSKLIGQGGCLIKEISQKSKGCNIKVMSDKNQDKVSQNVIVQLTGVLESKQLAATIILEKIEEFRGKLADNPQNMQQEEQKIDFFRNEQIEKEKNFLSKSQDSPTYQQRENNFHQKRNYHSNSRSPPNHQSSLSNDKGQRRKDCRDLEKSSFLDKDGEMRICINIIVPNNLVAMLIGRNGNIIKEIMSKTGAQIMFFREEDCGSYKTPEGNKGRICQIKGAAKETSFAFEILINQIIKLENSQNKKELKD